MPRAPKADTRWCSSQPDCDDATGSALILDGTLANGSELRAQLGLRGFVFEDPSSADVLAKAYQQWDKDVVHHLRGAFAFALWDAGRERLLLARDRFGEKPLYVCERAGSLYFASEMRALLRMPGIAAQPDPGAVHDYLAYRYVPAPRTLISGVRKLMPGTYALWQFGRLREVRYWMPPDRSPCTGLPRAIAEPVAAFTEKLDEAVQPARCPAPACCFPAAWIPPRCSRSSRATTRRRLFPPASPTTRRASCRAPRRSPSTSAPRTTRSCSRRTMSSPRSSTP